MENLDLKNSLYNRRNTKKIMVGDVAIGGDAPISIQSMTNTDTADAVATLAQINALAAAGCQIVRVTVNNAEAAEALKVIVPSSPIPVIADIHFDYKMALLAIENGVAALRLNPGNIGGADRVKMVAAAAKAKGIPIRVGVNSGSLSKSIIEKHGVTAQALVESAMEQIKLLEDCGFYDIKISLKASNVPLMLESYQKLAALTDYPFHIGVTESGTVERGSIKSAAGIGALIALGLGDTMRVSLAGDPVKEIFVAKEILRSMGLYSGGVEFIVCPTCGRTKIDLPTMAEEIIAQVDAMHIEKPLKIAIMGCVVNGPGEAREADFGIAGGINEGILFAKGEVVGKYPAEQLVDLLMAKIESVL